ncbi:hypothetical protein [Paludisphaera rhizosphaerae]|uniref:hypothetical protein n=1 Tax=Paludisphaera rhizosphaerae TaxID=2711216 RepID=UPI0013EC307C|nr:hypothetical protein [Paludisphaera rhizosphaerae]
MRLGRVLPLGRNLAIALAWFGASVFAQSPSPADVEERFRRLERLVADQADQIRELSAENRRLSERLSGDLQTPDPPATSLPAIIDDDWEAGDAATPSPTSPTVASDEAPGIVGAGGWRQEREALSALMDAGDASIVEPDLSAASRSYITGLYDKGYVLVAPSDKQRTPFSLKLNVTTQVRYTGFARSVETWTDSAGNVLPVRNRSVFTLNRNWFSFTGFAFSPRLRFTATVFSTSATNQTIATGLIGYEFSKALIVNGGYYKVPGTREWIESARYPLGVDRTMSNTFFRPGISSGVWAQGEPLRNVYYYEGIFDDLNSIVNSASRVNTNMTYAANGWWEPLGSFGPGFADEEFHQSPAVRLGASVTYNRSRREPDLELGQTNPENTILRLSDGTPLYQANALAQGVTLQAAHVLLASYDVGLKYRGMSLSSEVYTRWIYDLDPGAGGPRRSFGDIFDTGGFAQASYALVPRRLELFTRASGVFGPFGDGSEYGGGGNWYFFDNRNVRATFEAKRINHSPANNVLYGYFTGQSGMLFQLQLLTDF